MWIMVLPDGQVRTAATEAEAYQGAPEAVEVGPAADPRLASKLARSRESEAERTARVDAAPLDATAAEVCELVKAGRWAEARAVLELVIARADVRAGGK